jgi:hypothetical protein
VEKEVTREVEKEVAKEVEKELQPTASPVVPAAQPTPTPAGTATAAPTGAPTPTAGPQAATPAPQAPPPLLGQFVPETIYWAPEAISDAEGQIEIEIPLPALPATWRLTALASTRQGELGSGSAILHAAP